MPELTAVFDGGETIEYRGGRPEKRGIIVFRASVNEARPVDFIFTYPFYLKETIIKYFSKITFHRPEIDTTQHRDRIDPDEYKQAMQMSLGSDLISDKVFMREYIEEMNELPQM